MPDAIPAATVIIFRDAAAGPPELLMVERAKAMAFAGGAMVFPGGRIDPGDHALAAALPDAPDDAAARIAAIRETIEEAGVAIGFENDLDAATTGHLRSGLHAGEPLGALLDAAELTLDLARLTPFARWCPAHAHMRIFDTRFYVTGFPRGAPEPEIDATENVRLIWSSARAALDDADAGRTRIIFPTRRNLERLAQFGSLADAHADASAYPVRTITPWVEEREGVSHLCIDDDLGYPVTAERIERAMRG
ncbi:NUDIX domain-containing protein [Hephaestia mangrovi]|uniref:NUDIX domain-containing protein n=1 Tax=Hephaestia mangrovi TaxID=2873268 RepID=UPI001CA76F6E|nr:NUDIX domain-containing protein [Hephaestia mangrovi]MBY8827236.1 NUDIX domain-containing protein [Hephaestia mangrovi]